MFEFMTIIKALADTNRVRILCVLREQELCVCQIIEILGLAPSTVSKHLSILRQARLLEDRKEARWMYYRHPDKPTALVKKVLALLGTFLVDDEQMQVDRECVKGLLCVEKEEISRAQKKK